MEKLELLNNVKKECKKLMEEAVTKKFIHIDSSSVTALCSTIETCIVHRLKKRAGGLLPAANNSDEVLSKLTKFCPTAENVSRLSARLYQIHESKGRFSPETELNTPEKRWLNGYTVTGFCTKYLWIRLALLEKVLTAIINSLVENWRIFYEPDALLADQVNGPSLVWLLDGPCSLDYSKMKTPENIWTDPSAFELVQRHKIYSSPTMSHNLKSTMSRRKRLFSGGHLNTQSTIPGVPSMAREHVDSLHQNAATTCLYGKNNVVLSLADFPAPIQGYLSLHKSCESLLLKWTPNPMLHTDELSNMIGEKSKYWEQAITIDLLEVVYLHCHHTGNTGGKIVLISQDGIQLAPLSFPSGASLVTFVTCLEQGLNPDGRLDPPIFNKDVSFLDWPKLNMLPNKLKPSEKEITRDYVFRIVFAPASSIDKTQLKKLLSRNASPTKLKPPWSKETVLKKTLLPRMHAGARLQRPQNIPSKVALNLACEKMKHQILLRAFNGWMASYRHLKTVRTHLASLVLPWSGEDSIPANVDKGLTEGIWTQMKAKGLMRHIQDIKQYVYYGGVEASIRSGVWPYLLGHYSFTADLKQIDEFDESFLQNYLQVLQDCKAIEQILQEKEKELLALNGFANGETFNHSDFDVESVKTLDVTDSNAENVDDMISQDLSLCSNVSEPIQNEICLNSEEQRTKLSNSNDNALITSLIETKESLREIVENASKRGAEAWRKLLKKKKKKVSIKKTFKPKDVSDGITTNAVNGDLHPKFIPQNASFDLELDCQHCGKKIIESKQTVLDGKLNDSSIEFVECFACSEERKQKNEQVMFSDDTYKHGLSPSSVIYDRGNDDGADYVLINGEGTPLQKRASVSSVESGYTEDILKDFALNIHRIDKDVLRCDRSHPYFSSEKNLEKLRNIIMCYVWERLNIGYIQGMCDLCAPLLVVMDDEAKVFGCFVKLMDRMCNNFPHGDAMDLHLSNISSLIQILDPELQEILEVHGDNTIFYFCYRWFLLDFKRELQYNDIYVVWETIWAATSISSEHFSLFVALAIIELYREIIIDNKMDFTDIIKFFNEMAEQHDAQATLNLARNIVRKLQDIMHIGENEFARIGDLAVEE